MTNEELERHKLLAVADMLGAGTAADVVREASATIDSLRAALKKWLEYDNQDEADFSQSGPMFLYAEAIEATRAVLQPK